MNTYFKNVQTLEELRIQYKVLLKKYHSDNGNGSEEIFKIEQTLYPKRDIIQTTKINHRRSDLNDIDKRRFISNLSATGR